MIKSDFSFIGCSFKIIYVNGFDKWGVTIVVSELRVEPILQIKPYVHSTATIAHFKYDFG